MIAPVVARPVMRYHGGKFRLAHWIIGHFPTHRVYVEPFGGAASVLLQKPRAYAEVYNDLDGNIVNVMRVLRDPAQCGQLAELLALTPYAREEYHGAWAHTDDPMERARRTIVRAQMGFGSTGATKGSTGFRCDTGGDYGTAMNVWQRMPDRLAAFCQRLQGVLLENRPALQVIRDHDTEETLFYIDPPYIHDTRRMASDCYRHEMSDEEHRALLDVLLSLHGMVVLSGYPHPIYDAALGQWRRVETNARVAAQRGSAFRREVLWISPRAAGRDLFG